MATKAVQIRKGTTAEIALITGLNGEMFFDTTKKTLVVNDGTQAGGYPLARADDSRFELVSSAVEEAIKEATPTATNSSLGLVRGAVSSSAGSVQVASDGTLVINGFDAKLDVATYNQDSIYSGAEVDTGKKWLDGRPIYRKYVDCGKSPANSSKTVSHGIANIDTTTVHAQMWLMYNSAYHSVPFAFGDYACTYTVQNDVVHISNNNPSMGSADIMCFIEYCKTTDA